MTEKSKSNKGQESDSTKTEKPKKPIDITSKLEVFNMVKSKKKKSDT
jgi:hypothetical protein